MFLDVFKRVVGLLAIFALSFTGAVYGGCGCEYDDNGYHDEHHHGDSKDMSDDMSHENNNKNENENENDGGMLDPLETAIDETGDMVENAVDAVDDAVFGDDDQ